MERTLKIVQARHAIEDVLYRYADAVDEGDLSALADVLAACTLQLPDGRRLTGGREIADHYRSIIRFYDDSGNEADPEPGRCTPRTRHVTSNVRFDFDGQVTTAAVRSYFTAYQTVDGRNEIVAGGRYVDRFDRTLSGWVIVERSILVDNLGDMSRHLRAPLAGAAQ